MTSTWKELAEKLQVSLASLKRWRHQMPQDQWPPLLDVSKWGQLLGLPGSSHERYAKTVTALAKHLGVSQSTIRSWRAWNLMRPKAPSKQGRCYDILEWKQFCELNMLGVYNLDRPFIKMKEDAEVRSRLCQLEKTVGVIGR